MDRRTGFLIFGSLLTLFVASLVYGWPWQHTFSTYRWPGPFGWAARETPGNVVAGFLLSGVGFVLGYGAKRLGLFERMKRWLTRDVDEELAKAAAHRKWEAEVLASLHVKVLGAPVAVHPEHGQL